MVLVPHVEKVNFGTVPCLPQLVKIAPLDSLKATKGRSRASHAAPENTVMILALLSAKSARNRRITAGKEEKSNALIAPPVGRPKTAVPNAKRVA